MVETEAVALGGTFFGIFGRTVLAYWKARREARILDPNLSFEFDKEYLGTALFSAVGAGAASILLFPQVIAGLPLGSSMTGIFAYAFGFGWFANDVVNMAVSVGQSTIRATKEQIAEIRQFLQQKRQSKPA